MGTDLWDLVVGEVGIWNQKSLCRMAQRPCNKVFLLTPFPLFLNSKLPFGEEKGVSPLL